MSSGVGHEEEDEEEGDDEEEAKRLQMRQITRVPLPKRSTAGFDTCQYCKTVFTSFGGLQFHLENRVCLTYDADEVTQDGDKLECPKCGNTFESAPPFRYHIKTNSCGKNQEKEAIEKIANEVL